MSTASESVTIAHISDLHCGETYFEANLLDRPYRRLVDDLPLRHVGFTVPDELFAGYGLGLMERWRAFPDLHFVAAEALPPAAAHAA